MSYDKKENEHESEVGNVNKSSEHARGVLFVVVLLLSLGIRIVAWYGVTSAGVRPLYDETEYLARALGAADVMSSLAHGEHPARRSMDEWYGRAVFPPLFPLILSAGMLLPMDDLSAARFVNVLLSSATTALVFLLVYNMTRRKNTAAMAALLHAIYPSFIGFSHLLWSETIFGLLLILGVILIVALSAATSRSGAYGYTLLAGVCMGCLLLVRAAALPPVIAIVGYVFWDCYRQRGLRGTPLWLTFVAAIILTVAPWQLTMFSRSESGFISGVNGITLYMGNNPWVPLELGAAFPTETRVHVARSVAQSNLPPSRLALYEITSHPGTTLLRMLSRFRMLLSPDAWVVRHALKVCYPPMPLRWVLLLLLMCFGSYWMFGGLIIRGLCEPNILKEYRWLLLLIVLALSVGPILTVARSRYHQPMILVLIPFAAIGAQQLFRPITCNRAIAWGCAILLFFVTSASAIPVMCRWTLGPSTYYHELSSYPPFTFAVETHFEDMVLIRSDAGLRYLQGMNVDVNKGKVEVLVHPRHALLGLKITTVQPSTPAQVVLTNPGTGGETVVDTIEPKYWCQWASTPLDGVQFQWNGSNPPDRWIDATEKSE